MIRAGSCSTILGLASIFAVSACSDHRISGREPEPVISFVLMAGESVQVASVTFGFNPDDSIPLHSPPVAFADVNIRVTGADSVPHSLGPLPGRPGYFQVSMAVLPGATYQLDGVVAGRTVVARTTVPSQFAIIEPSSDTVVLVPGQSFRDSIAYRFEAIGADGFEIVVQSDEMILFGRDFLSDSGVVQVSRTVPVEIRAPLLFAAYNTDASGWLQRHTPIQNISGVLGGFGAALLHRRTLWYQCPC